MSMIFEGPKKDRSGASYLTEVDLGSLRAIAERIRGEPSEGIVGFRVVSSWQGQVRSRATVTSWSIGGDERSRDFDVMADEPKELAGTDTAPNPQELFLAAINACLIAGFVVEAALRGVTIETLRVETHGELDLRGVLGVCEDVRPGYESIGYVIQVKGNATPEQFAEMHHTVQARSPVCFNVTRPTRLAGRIEVIE